VKELRSEMIRAGHFVRFASLLHFLCQKLKVVWSGALGIDPYRIEELKDVADKECRVAQIVDAFIHSRFIATYSELERFTLELFNIPSFDQLRMGPLAAYYSVKQAFGHTIYLTHTYPTLVLCSPHTKAFI
jgi:hypothetical protein